MGGGRPGQPGQLNTSLRGVAGVSIRSSGSEGGPMSSWPGMRVSEAGPGAELARLIMN